MNPFETIAIKLLFTAENAPADFISGLIDALNEDLQNREPDAQENVNILMTRVANIQSPKELISTAKLLYELSELWKKNEKIQKQADIVQKINEISQSDLSVPFGSRIALERISNLAETLKRL